MHLMAFGCGVASHLFNLFFNIWDVLMGVSIQIRRIEQVL
jgi:hypothetical protein